MKRPGKDSRPDKRELAEGLRPEAAESSRLGRNGPGSRPDKREANRRAARGSGKAVPLSGRNCREAGLKAEPKRRIRPARWPMAESGQRFGNSEIRCNFAALSGETRTSGAGMPESALRKPYIPEVT